MKKIGQYNLEGKLIKVYSSLTKASFENGFELASISRCCNNKQKTAYDFIWKYISNEEYTSFLLDKRDKILYDSGVVKAKPLTGGIPHEARRADDGAALRLLR